MSKRARFEPKATNANELKAWQELKIAEEESLIIEET